MIQSGLLTLFLCTLDYMCRSLVSRESILIYFTNRYLLIVLDNSAILQMKIVHLMGELYVWDSDDADCRSPFGVPPIIISS